MHARKALLAVVNNIIGSALGFAALVLIGRSLPPTTFGLMGVALSIATLTGTMSAAGVDTAHVKRVSEGRDLGHAVATYASIRLGLIALAFAAVLATSPWWLRAVDDAVTFRVLAAFAMHGIFLQLRGVLLDTFQARQEMAKMQAAYLVENLVRLPAIAGVVWLWQAGASGLGAEDAAVLLGAAYAVGSAASLIFSAGLFIGHRYPVKRFDRNLALSYLRFAAPMLPVVLAGALIASIDAISIGLFWSAADAAPYLVATRFLEFGTLIIMSGAMLFFPLISQTQALAPERVASLVEGARRMVGVAMTAYAVLLLAAPFHLTALVTGDGYEGTAAILMVAALSAPLYGLLQVASATLRGLELLRVVAMTSALLLATKLVLNAVLIPSSLFGAPMAGLRGLGAVTSTVVAQVLAVAFTSHRLRKAVGIRFVPAQLPHQVFAAALALGALWATPLRPWIDGLPAVPGLMVAIAVGLVAYVVALAAIGGLHRGDIRTALDTIHPGRMMRYIRDELRPAGADRTV